MAQLRFHHQQGNEAQHRHPAIQPLGVGVEAVAGETPLGHERGLNHGQGGMGW